MPNRKKMEPTLKKKWVKALRSGKYEQGTGTLKKSNWSDHTEYCCLGVLCDIQPKKVGTWDEMGFFVGSDDKILGHDILTAPMLELTGITKRTQNILTELNDEGGLSFVEIADWIEAEL